MECRVLVLVCIVAIQIAYCFPALEGKYSFEDISDSMNNTVRNYVIDIRKENEDLPLQCQTDVCNATYFIDDLKGRLNFPRTPVGYRTYIHCPFAFDEPLYAHRDCVFTTMLSIMWSPLNSSSCPGPPLYEAVKTMPTHNWKKEKDSDVILHAFRYLVGVINRFPDTAVSRDAEELIPVFTLTTLTLQLIRDQAVSPGLLADVINVTDFLMRGYFSIIMRGYDRAIKSLIMQFPSLEDVLKSETRHGTLTLTSSNDRVRVFVRRVTSHMAERLIDEDANEVSVTVHGDAGQNEWLYLMYFEASIYAHLFRTSPLEGAPAEDNENEKEDKPQSISTGSDTLKGFSSNVNLSNVTPGRSHHRGRTGDVTPLNPSKPRVVDPSPFKFDKHPDMVIVPGFMYYSTTARNVTRTSVSYSRTLQSSEDKICARSPLNETIYATDVDLGRWYHSINGTFCEMVVNGNATTCSCQAQGFLGLFIREGFPYSWHLYVAGHVFRAVSLACLIVTVLSFAIFRKTRRGRPTMILLHLCASLIALLVVLYLAEVTGASKRGCVAANILRFYLVLASLLWNGVEAYNMYLMLIRVFDSNIHRFLTKASILAWGLPAVILAVILAVDKTGFNGVYEDCKFRCKLRDSTLYYGYLLPMGIILLHNVIVFVMITRVLFLQSRSPVTEAKPAGNGWRQLCGAVGVLVLLGVPWLFSSFGAIANDASNSLRTLEAVFQIIFVVSINLQGMFIFAFHCLRNADVRKHWLSVVSSGEKATALSNTSQTQSTGI